MNKLLSLLKNKLASTQADLKKLRSAAELIKDNDPAMGMLLNLHQLKNDPEAKLHLALKFGLPAAGIAGLIIGGSKGNRDAMRSEEY